MSASVLLLHRMLVQPGQRGWRGAATSGDDPGRELTQTAPSGNALVGQNLKQSQIVNVDSWANPNERESPQYSPTEHQKDRHG